MSKFKGPFSLWERQRREFLLKCDNIMTVTLFSGTPQPPSCLSVPIISSVCLPWWWLYLSPFLFHALRDYTHTHGLSLSPAANIRHALNLSHILMDDSVDRPFANCRAIPLTLCLLPYLFDWIQEMRQNGLCEKETESEKALQWVVEHLTVKTAVFRDVERVTLW